MSAMCILIADDEAPARFGMKRALAQGDYQILEAENGREALEVIRNQRPDLVFLDLQMPELNGQNLLRELGPEERHSEIIIVTANSSVNDAVQCIRLGASDFIAKPFEVEQIRAIARRVSHRILLQSKVNQLQHQLGERFASGAILGISRQMQLLAEKLKRIAPSPANLLIRGESGAGKELIAREVHRLGPRPDGPFIAVNAAAIPESLTESEFFGHRKGAFTGADADRVGVFEQAHGGTLFLDEIGDMPMAAQVKILRVLQERLVQPVGSSKSIPVDVRVISATHQNLEDSVASGGFRQDLYYRIRGIELQVPPLRSRREDILLLANYFLERNSQHSLPDELPEFTSDAVDAMLSHPWPGNVRELEHAVVGALAFREDNRITSRDLGLARPEPQGTTFDYSRFVDLPLTEAKQQLIEEFEKTMIQLALDQNDGNVSAAARKLGMHRQSLQQKMTQLKLTRS
ncbi:sigma-54-dependent transcriptional regulator [Planctomicrobium sp. SH661]|uniref:sigma-54-dependent transcriptional regulator n=1 Tax=Planctomicrobium sp. SH661 TaxID=3448124 RepID=UPI003F5B90F2